MPVRSDIERVDLLMVKTICSVAVGVVLGLISGGAVTLAVPFGDASFAHIYLRHALCLAIGAGFGSVVGAIIGSARAILDAINPGRPSN
jgi:hypothetical protein